MKTIDDVPVLDAMTTAEWRAWLEKNGHTAKRIWVLARYASSKLPGMRMNEVIGHALCYGWSDTMLLKKAGRRHFLHALYAAKPEKRLGREISPTRRKDDRARAYAT